MATTSVSQGMKQIIIINEALHLSINQRVAQIARASIGAFFEAGKENKKTWIKEGRPKIILNVFNEDDLLDLCTKAEKRKLPIYLVKDKETLAASTTVCLGVGPVTETQVDQLMEIIDYYRWFRESAFNARI